MILLPTALTCRIVIACAGDHPVDGDSGTDANIDNMIYCWLMVEQFGGMVAIDRSPYSPTCSVDFSLPSRRPWGDSSISRQHRFIPTVSSHLMVGGPRNRSSERSSSSIDNTLRADSLPLNEHNRAFGDRGKFALAEVARYHGNHVVYASMACPRRSAIADAVPYNAKRTEQTRSGKTLSRWVLAARWESPANLLRRAGTASFREFNKTSRMMFRRWPGSTSPQRVLSKKLGSISSNLGA